MQPSAVRRLRKSDLTRSPREDAVLEFVDLQAVQPVGGLGRDRKRCKHLEVVQRHLRVFGDQLRPPFAPGVVDGGSHHAKVLSRIVHADVEETVTMVDGVLLVLHARCQHAKLCLGRVRLDVAILGCGVATQLNEQILAVPRPAHPHVEALIELLQHQKIVGLRCS